METRRKRTLAAAAAGVLALGASYAAVRGSGRPSGESEPSSTAASQVVPVKLRFPLPAGAALDAVTYVVKSAADAVLAQGSVAVHGEQVAADVVPLPVGRGETLTVVGHSKSGGVDTSLYLGSTTFDLGGERATEIVVGPALTNGAAASPAPAAGGVAAADPAAIPAAGGGGNLSACQACQHDSKAGICDPPNVTATSKTNDGTGEQTAIGWGCATLSTPAARSACADLLHCLNVNDCGEKDKNPVMACYCGQATPEACIGGQGLTGACVPQYHAAAAASPDGPPASAEVATLARFIATNASDPITAIGLADNVRHCAVATPCEICGAL